MAGYPGCRNLSFCDRDLSNQARNFMDDHSSPVTESKTRKVELCSVTELFPRRTETGLTFSIENKAKFVPLSGPAIYGAHNRWQQFHHCKKKNAAL